MESTFQQPQPTPLIAKLRFVAQDIKLSHSVFALPFAVLAMMLAGATTGRGHPSAVQWLLILWCMVMARTYAMTVNRWADARIDAANPRTAGRAIPAGRLSRGFVGLVALSCAALFVLGAAGFWLVDGNRWPAYLAAPLLALVGVYSYMKRFTWLCHVFLGLALGASPIAAAIAIAPESLGQAWPWLLGAAVLCWVAGFDVIYALQDVDTDRAQGVYSMPSKLGVEPALWISRLLHIAVVGLLAALALSVPPLYMLFNLAVAATAALLITEHALIIKSPQRHLNMAFFTVNGVISVLLGVAGVIDILVS